MAWAPGQLSFSHLGNKSHLSGSPGVAGAGRVVTQGAFCAHLGTWGATSVTGDSVQHVVKVKGTCPQGLGPWMDGGGSGAF